MDAALERGLAAEKVKVGAGNKAPGYAFSTRTLKKAALFLCMGASLLVLGTLFSYRSAVYQRYKVYMAEKRLYDAQLQGDANSIAQNMQLEAALSQQQTSKEDVLRIFKRIRSYTSSRIEDALALVPDDQAYTGIKVRDMLRKIEKYIDDERKDFEEEYERAEAKRREQIDALRQKQTEALEKLLTRVTDVRLEALEEMLSDLFERVETSVEVSLPEGYWEPLEDLVDRLYQEDLSLEQGRSEFNLKFRPYFGMAGLPSALVARVDAAKEHGELADVLDEIYEGAQIFKGREELKKINREWVKFQDTDKIDHHDEKAVEKAEQAYAKATVDAILQVQELINKGLIPQDFLDFDAIDLVSDDDDDDVGESERS